MEQGRRPSATPGDQRGFLIRDDWDDWFKFETTHRLTVRDQDGVLHIIGQVKIGQFGMGKGQTVRDPDAPGSGRRRPDLPEEFELLDTSSFSLGQDDSYYEKLGRLGEGLRAEVLAALRDLAADEELYQRAIAEDVTTTSLMRSVTQASVVGQFRRLARGGARLTSYRFVYEVPSASSVSTSGPEMDFEVVPDSEPPTNIHVLIGRNGVGKTHLLHHMTRTIVGDQSDSPELLGSFSLEVDRESGDNFANVVSVSFSAFDRFEPIGDRQRRAGDVQYAYVGLKRVRGSKDGEKPLPPKSPTALATEFGTSVKNCIQGPRLDRWQRALRVLAGDPIFADAGVIELAEESIDGDDEEVREKARSIFRRLSSGHKIVLLTVTRLVEKVEERSLVVLDEPEAHLHPPLLAAFVRALSDLLMNRNGVAIIATHSPVVLQEVPATCAWKLRRSGNEMVAERPEVETFGENVGVLTREVFGLEVTRSGFHKMLSDAVDSGQSYEAIVERFANRLGREAKGLIRALIAARDSADES